MFRILSINPGSTSTKVAVYEDEQCVFSRNIQHSIDELSHFDEPMHQLDYRKQLVISTLKEMNIAFTFNAVIGRGGLAKPVEGGVYKVNQYMLDVTRHALHQHACDLGCLIAYDIAKNIPQCIAMIADPGVVDELSPLARISGSPLLPRYCMACTQPESHSPKICKRHRKTIRRPTTHHLPSGRWYLCSRTRIRTSHRCQQCLGGRRAFFARTSRVVTRGRSYQIVFQWKVY